jgi:CTP synthase
MDYHLSLTKPKIACRCERPLAKGTVNKIALHCQVEVEQVVVVRDMPTIYQVPLLLSEQNLVPLLRSKLNLDALSIPPSLAANGAELWEIWKSVTTQTFEATIDIALVGKYVQTHDAYLSVEKSLEHSSMRIGRKLNLRWIDSEHLELKTQAAEPAKYQAAWEALKTASGISKQPPFAVLNTRLKKVLQSFPAGSELEASMA